MIHRLFRFTQKLEDNLCIRAMHGGLLMLIPILLTGAFALAFRSLPIPVYLTFIRTFCGGIIDTFLLVIYSATFELLAVYMTVFIGLNYGREKNAEKKVDFGNISVALVVFFILSGAHASSFTLDSLGPKGMFTALVASLFSSFIYWKIKAHYKPRIRLYSDGTDIPFNYTLSILQPLVITILLFALANELLSALAQVTCFYELFIHVANALFSLDMPQVVRGILYVFVSSLLWFFGIHGSDCLEGVAENYFIPATNLNLQEVAAGLAPTEIFTRSFFDTFVLMGGCGTAICLVVALLLFSKRRSNRMLTKMAALPMLFNINEVLIFGLPVILNPIMLAPFLLVPLLSFATSYAAMATGLVPLVVTDFEWTTPILLSGYLSTGSLMGTLLQLVNLVLGVAIYAPFVKLMDQQHAYTAASNYKELVKILQKAELSGKELQLSSLEGFCGVVAKSLTMDLAETIEKNSFEMYYQPQYAYSGECIGVEALLRWNHPSYGMIYPPLAIKLAEEADLLMRLETQVLSRVLVEVPKIEDRFGKGIKISVNVTGATIVKEEYYEFIRREKEIGHLDSVNLCLEVTEQIAIGFDSHVERIFNKIKALGIYFAIDDFSMGQTSIDYLKGNLFAILKLDGSLVKGLTTNPNCCKIVESICQLAKSLDIDVLAEFVETPEQREILHQAGCDLYQGYLYSKAVKL